MNVIPSKMLELDAVCGWTMHLLKRQAILAHQDITGSPDACFIDRKMLIRLPFHFDRRT